MTGVTTGAPQGPAGSGGLGPVVTVAGSGPSLRAIDYTRLDPAAPVVRINNFFFEEAYYLGPRVDLVHVGGERRLLPFYLATLERARRQGGYALGAWTAHEPDLAARVRRRFDLCELPFRLRDGGVAAALAAAIARHDRKPTSGIHALLNAHGHGAAEIRMAGLDFYRTPERYAFPAGRHMRDLLGPDIAARGYDHRLHSPALDLELLDYLQGRDDLRLYLTALDAPLRALVDLAPPVAAAMPAAVSDAVSDAAPAAPFGPQPKSRPLADWDGRVRGYPIGLLKLLRRVRRFQRGLAGQPRDW